MTTTFGLGFAGAAAAGAAATLEEEEAAAAAAAQQAASRQTAGAWAESRAAARSSPWSSAWRDAALPMGRFETFGAPGTVAASRSATLTYLE